MKKYLQSTALITLLLCLGLVARANSPVSLADSTGLPGDHFSLEGALELFKDAQSLEDFEKKLNEESSDVNNLDLNEDGEVDYIRVVDNMEKDVHAIVLQVPVNAKESQDIAVIEIEKTAEEEAMLQIIGDADVYGEEVIVEPYETKVEGSKRGPAPATVTRVIINVWFWPSVRFVYGPRYRVWVSPWRWGYYPRYWRPWRPRPWRAYRTRVAVFSPRYRVVTTHRVVRARRIYTPVRRRSTIVRTRTTRITTVNRSRGRVNGVQTQKTTVSKRPNGTVTKRTTTTKANRAGKATRTTTTKARKTNRGTTVKRTKTTTKARRRGN